MAKKKSAETKKAKQRVEKESPKELPKESPPPPAKPVAKNSETNAELNHKTHPKAHLKKIWNYLNSDGVIPWILQLALAFIVIKFVLFPVLGLIFGTQLPIVAVMSGSMEHRATDNFVCGRFAPADYKGSFDDYWSACGAWYEARGMTKEQFSEFPLKNGFNKGDIMVIVGPQRGGVEVGDVLVYEARERYPIIHRVISVVETETTPVYQTKGDFNGEQISHYVVTDGRTVSSCHQNGQPAPCAVSERVNSTTPGAIGVLDETLIVQDQIIGKAVLRIPYLGWIKIGFTSLIDWVLG